MTGELRKVGGAVLGDDLGCDEYLVKPFAFPELVARVRALLRRAKPASSSYLALADLSLDLNGRVATRQGRLLDLTSRDFDPIEYFLVNRGNAASREMPARDVWKESLRYTSLDNVIDVQIARLRRKVDDPFPNKLLHTVRSVGVVLREGAVSCAPRLRVTGPATCGTALRGGR